MTRKLRVAALGAVAWAATGGPRPLSVEITPEMRERCHIVRFPQGWTAPANPDGALLRRYFYSYRRDYEFRIVGELGSRFLIAGVTDNGYGKEPPTYTINKYLVDLSDLRTPVLTPNEEMWDEGAIVPQTKKSIMRPLAPDSKVFQINGRILPKSGQHWAEDRLSPDGRWIVLQSWQGRVWAGGEPWDFKPDWGMLLGYKGKAFWDIYDADTGRKVLTIKGRYNYGGPSALLTYSFWLTERYFIVPLGEHREQCLVCEFGGKTRPKR